MKRLTYEFVKEQFEKEGYDYMFKLCKSAVKLLKN